MDIAESQLYDTVQIRSPDTDVMLLLMYFANDMHCKIVMDTGSGDKRRLLDINDIALEIGQDMCSALLGLHAFTGCDSTSSLMKKGKLRPIKLMKKDIRFMEAFQRLGTTDDVTNADIKIFELFIIKLYGGKKHDSDLDSFRYAKFMLKFTPNDSFMSCDVGIDLSLLPPCKMSLHMHIKRANYQARLWRLAYQNIPDIPGPIGRGWIKTPDNNIVCQWFIGACMPQDLIDLLEDDATSTLLDNEDNEDNDYASDYDGEDDDDNYDTDNEDDNDDDDDDDE
jgi:hypothetical protein